MMLSASTSRQGRISTSGFLVILALSLLARPVGAQSTDWVSHVDPSLISGIDMRDGELYLATSGGLVIFDPSDGSSEQFTNIIGLPGNFLTALAFDADGSLWVGTEDSGIARLDARTGGFSVTPLNAAFNGLSDDRITSITAWGDTMVYGSQDGAGLIISDFPGQRFSTNTGLPSDHVNDVLADGDRVWLATDSGVVFVDRLGIVRGRSDGLPGPTVYSLGRTDTTVWAGTNNGVARYDELVDAWVPEGIAGEPVFSMMFADGVLWVGTRAQVYSNAGGGWMGRPIFDIYGVYEINNRIAEIRALWPMPGGDVYVGAAEPDVERRGVNLLLLTASGESNIQFNAPPENRITRMSFDSDGSLWVASASFGIGKFSPSGQWLNYNSSTGDTNLTRRTANLALLADSRGSKWIGPASSPSNPQPLDELQDGRDLDPSNDVWTHHDLGSGGGDGLGSLRNFGAAEDPAGNVWLLSDDTAFDDGWWGINILSADRSGWRQVNPVSTAGGMGSGNVSDVVFGANGIVYVALRAFGVQQWTTRGYDASTLFDLGDDRWDTVDLIGGRIDSDASISSLALRSDGVIWIGTTTGVYRWEKGSLRQIEANRGSGFGLLANNVRDVLLDRDENLWVATDLGLNRISRSDESEILSFTTPAAWQSQLALFFFLSDVQSPLVNANCEVLALHPTRDLLYIGTRGGLSVLNLAALKAKETDLSRVFLYPNPIRGRRGDTALKIGNVESPVNVEIYNLEGDLVHVIRNVIQSEDVIWDLTTESGFLAASGVYLVRISNERDTVIKRIALIR